MPSRHRFACVPSFAGGSAFPGRCGGERRRAPFYGRAAGILWHRDCFTGGMDHTIEILGKLMDATALRQKVLSNNLANANTPGYLRKEVEFGDALAHALGKGPEAVRKVRPEVVVDDGARVDERGNSVSIQKEMGEISQNALLYDFAAEMTGQKFNTLRKAITGTK